jgi:SAM-dependent methyltransferase
MSVSVGASREAVAGISPLGREALDSPRFDPELTRRTLRDISRANALLGGRAAVAYGVSRLFVHRSPGPLTLLDVGAGCGDIARYLEQRWSRAGWSIAARALDWHREAAKMCDEATVPAVVGDGRVLPVATDGVDIVVASQLAHHYSNEAATLLLEELSRVARVGVVVADLRRARLAEWGIWMASHILRFHPVSRRDGLISVRRGYTRRELSGLLERAKIHGVVERRPGYRLVAYWETAGADG